MKQSNKIDNMNYQMRNVIDYKTKVKLQKWKEN